MRSMPSNHRRFVAALALALAVVTGACGGSAKTESSVDKSKFATLDTPPPAGDVAGGVCIDQTPSIDPAVPELARKLLVERLANWVPPQRDTVEASPAVPALHLLVRRVTSDIDALGVGGLVANIAIPSVPPVAAAPGHVPNVVQLQNERAKQLAAAEKAHGPAATAATKAAEAVAQGDFSSPESEIRGCVEALARAMPRGTFLLVSDLEQYGVPQVGVASLKEVQLIIVHACRVADRCIAQTQEWTRTFTDAGGTPPVFLSVENMAAGFDRLLGATSR